MYRHGGFRQPSGKSDVPKGDFSAGIRNQLGMWGVLQHQLLQCPPAVAVCSLCAGVTSVSTRHVR